MYTIQFNSMYFIFNLISFRTLILAKFSIRSVFMYSTVFIHYIPNLISSGGLISIGTVSCLKLLLSLLNLLYATNTIN